MNDKLTELLLSNEEIDALATAVMFLMTIRHGRLDVHVSGDDKHALQAALYLSVLSDHFETKDWDMLLALSGRLIAGVSNPSFARLVEEKLGMTPGDLN